MLGHIFVVNVVFCVAIGYLHNQVPKIDIHLGAMPDGSHSAHFPDYLPSLVAPTTTLNATI